MRLFQLLATQVKKTSHFHPFKHSPKVYRIKSHLWRHCFVLTITLLQILFNIFLLHVILIVLLLVTHLVIIITSIPLLLTIELFQFLIVMELPALVVIWPNVLTFLASAVLTALHTVVKTRAVFLQALCLSARTASLSQCDLRCNSL